LNEGSGTLGQRGIRASMPYRFVGKANALILVAQFWFGASIVGLRQAR
jgi:hypothetical protein